MLFDDIIKKYDRFEVNVNRSLGDVLKKWKEMVQMLDDSFVFEVDVIEDKESLEESVGVVYEYVFKEEVGSVQVFGVVIDDQLINIQGLEFEDEEVSDDFEFVLFGIEEL